LGDAIDGQSSTLSKHFRAERIAIVFNTLVNNNHGIEIGFDNNDNYGKHLEDINVANNLIIGSENSLVQIVDTDNDQGDNITWKSNLMYATGNATLLGGATITSFNATEVIDENPNLAFDNSLNIWRSTTSTPLYEYTLNIVSINEDIDGHVRPLISNPGTDHCIIETVRFKPITPDDFGPNTYENPITSLSIGGHSQDVLF